MQVVDTITIPVLAFFGGRDTQIDSEQAARRYRAALARGGHPLSRVEVVPGTDHDIITSETGCIAERLARPRSGWTNYAAAYLDTLEEWLRALRDTGG
jgi:pimeloyl-ACP methyl ester carboxylesterase